MLPFAMEFPLDDEGFIDRECPVCERHFRWHHGPVNPDAANDSEPETNDEVLTTYFCPYCGEPAPADQWWTREQVNAMAQAVRGVAMREIDRMLRDAFRGNKSVRVQQNVPTPSVPGLNDLEGVGTLTALEPQCHPEEPIKVDLKISRVVHCLVCGSLFQV